MTISRHAALASLLVAAGCSRGPATPQSGSAPASLAGHRLPTGVVLDPAGPSFPVGNMPLAASASPDGRFVVVSLSGWREQGLDIVDRASDSVVQRLRPKGAFLGLAWSRDGHTLYASGGVTDMIYSYAWHPEQAAPAALVDSIDLGHASTTPGSTYPAGLALSPDGRSLYVAENLGDSLAVVDLPSRTVRQRLSVGSYPYAVAAAPDGHVYVSAWGGGTVADFRAVPGGLLAAEHPIDAGRHPSALVLNASGSRLYVASASTDRIAVVDTRAHRVLRWLHDPPPGGVREGSTPNALDLSSDGTRLYVAEADANAVAVFLLSPSTAGVSASSQPDTLLGRIPTQWYPTAVLLLGESLWVVNGKGRGTAPNPTGIQPNVRLSAADPNGYTLGQLNGSITIVPVPPIPALDALSARVARANGWDAPPGRSRRYPPFQHVIYIIKENRTYDQMLGDLPQADGDTALLFFPRPITPNHHALAERFGIFDRFFVNAEVSNDGHPWSTAAYVTDFVEKTTPDDYRLIRPERDEPGDADDPAVGYLWDQAIRGGLTVRNYGEYGEWAETRPGDSTSMEARATIASLEPYTSPTFHPFDLRILDQRRIDSWRAEFRAYEKSGRMPALEIMHLGRDHTAGVRPGWCTPKACVADNDAALGQLVDAVSHSPLWRSTVVFVLEDDAQDGPDHVDSHRSVLLVISAWNRGGVLHRFVNTSDVVATIEEILGLPPMSSFDHFGRPLREIWTTRPDLAPYTALVPAQSMAETNLATGPDARRSARIDLAHVDRVDEQLFNHILWRAIKGGATPYPAPRRAASREYTGGQ